MPAITGVYRDWFEHFLSNRSQAGASPRAHGYLRFMASWRRRLAVCAVIGGVAFAAITGVWVFAPIPGSARSPWSVIVAERTTLGALRLAVIAGCLYVVVSVPALIRSRRWLKSIGPAGISSDEGLDTVDTVGILYQDFTRVLGELRIAFGLYQAARGEGTHGEHEQEDFTG